MPGLCSIFCKLLATMSFKMVGFPASKMHREVDDGLTKHAKYKFVIHRLLNFYLEFLSDAVVRRRQPQVEKGDRIKTAQYGPNSGANELND